MAILHGKTAEIYWDSQGTDTNLQHGQGWTLDLTSDVAEITSIQDTARTYAKGFADWTATVECLLDSTGQDIPNLAAGEPEGLGELTGARLELYMEWDTGTPLYISFYGNGHCTGVSVTDEKDSTVTVTYTFQGSGAMAWDTGAARP